jgi:hypothetical protein
MVYAGPKETSAALSAPGPPPRRAFRNDDCDLVRLLHRKQRPEAAARQNADCRFDRLHSPEFNASLGRGTGRQSGDQRTAERGG